MSLRTVLHCAAAPLLATAATAQALDLTHIGTMSITNLQLGGVGGLAIDHADGSLWLSDGTALTNEVVRISGLTGVAISSFPASVVPGIQGGPDALVRDPSSGDLILFSAFNPVAAGRVTSSGALVDAFTISIAVTAAAFSNANELFVAGKIGTDRFLCRMDPLDGAILSSVSLGALTDDVVAMAFDTPLGHLYCLLKSSNVIVEVQPGTGAVLSQTTLPSNLTIQNDVNAGMAFNELGNVLYVSKGTLAEADRIHVLARELEVSYCAGDAASAACPCANHGAAGSGCANSVFPEGARLAASGNALVSADSTTLRCSRIPPGANALFYQGTLPLGGVGTVFGDGLRCVGGIVIRLGTEQAAASGLAQYPGPGDLDVSVRGLVPAAGASRFYQVWYRNAAAFCTPSTFNLSNGVRLLWAP